MSNLSALQTLHDVFGYSSFRGEQKAIVEHVTSGGDALVLMPTGGGKSLCYQLPALLRAGVAIVVSPLIALMQDQVDALKQLGVRAAFLNSSQDADEARAITAQLMRGELQIVYVAPERLLMSGFLAMLEQLNSAAPSPQPFTPALGALAPTLAGKPIAGSPIKGEGVRTFMLGLSASTVPMPVSMAQLLARQCCTSSRAGSLVIHWLAPLFNEVLPSKLAAILQRIKGCLRVMREIKPGLSASACACISPLATTILCACKCAKPLPATSGLGSCMAAITFEIPACSKAWVHGGVRPVWLHGSKVT